MLFVSTMRINMYFIICIAQCDFPLCVDINMSNVLSKMLSILERMESGRQGLKYSIYEPRFWFIVGLR